MIGGDEQGAAFGSYRKFDSAKTRVHGFYGFDRRLKLPGMTDHVGIGEIYNHDVERSIFDRLDDSICDSRGTHLRLQIVGGHFL